MSPTRVFAALLVLSSASVLAAADAPKPGASKPDAKTDKEQIQGTWKVVGRAKQGERTPDAEVAEHPVTLTFAGDAVREVRDGKPKDEGTFKLDPSAAPKRITLTGADGRAFEGIYELAGDTLKIAYGVRDGAGKPPKDFTGGENAGLLVLERQKGDGEKADKK
ncbi:MAG TPA: TIGR03067 domain-containing protein [Humisphaera sp.]